MTRRKQRAEQAGDDFLPEAELEVLACLHDLGEAEASELRVRMEPYRPMTHASMVTLLKRLEARGLVTHRKADRGKAFVYTATRDARETYQSVIERLLERVFRDKRLEMVASLFDAKAPTEKELGELRDLVDSLQKRKRK